MELISCCGVCTVLLALSWEVNKMDLVLEEYMNEWEIDRIVSLCSFNTTWIPSMRHSMLNDVIAGFSRRHGYQTGRFKRQSLQKKIEW